VSAKKKNPDFVRALEISKWFFFSGVKGLLYSTVVQFQPPLGRTNGAHVEVY
jgi:hypothetical protein